MSEPDSKRPSRVASLHVATPPSVSRDVFSARLLRSHSGNLAGVAHVGMRIGYPAPWTLGEQLNRGWFGSAGTPSFKYWQRVCRIAVDGRTLYDTHPLRCTPSAHEIRYSQKFSEVMIAACALARLAAQNIAVATGGMVPVSLMLGPEPCQCYYKLQMFALLITVPVVVRIHDLIRISKP